MTRSREELLADAAFEQGDAMRRLDYCTELAKTGLQSLTVVNGGALVALFTLIGTGKLTYTTGPLWSSFSAFVLGIAGSLLAFILGYAAQNQFYYLAAHRSFNLTSEAEGRPASYDEAKHQSAGDQFLRFAIVSAATSIVAFMLGAALALAAFT